MRYSDILQSCLANFAKGNQLVPNIEGRPGGGKSTLAREIISQLGIRPERITEFNPSLRDPVDIMGVPRTDGDVAKWIPMPEFYRIRDDGTDEPCALIIEELSDAPMPMQNPMCRVILDNYAGELKLHPKVFKIATGNRTEDKSGATRMSTKLGNRMQTLTFDENLDDWCLWAFDKGIDLKIIQFLRFKPALLSDFDPNRKINPTPRSWAMANDVEETLPTDLYFANVAGCVGEGAAAEYTGFKRIFESLPNIDSLLMNPSKAEVPTDPAVRYALAGAIAHRTTKDNFDRCMEFIERMPQDFQTMYIMDAMRQDSSVRNTKAYVKWTVANGNTYL
jgi:hypothetical protein